MKLIITRHGETIENQNKILQGHLPGQLSEKGWQQAQKLALRLKDEKIDAIYSSDLARASNTAITIFKYHPDAKIEFVGELREKYMGSWQGKTKHEINPDIKGSTTNHNAPDGETSEGILKRAHSFIHSLLHKHHDDTVLLVGHNGITKALITAITNKTADQIKEIQRLENTSVTIFEIDEDKNHKLILFNCNKHSE